MTPSGVIKKPFQANRFFRLRFRNPIRTFRPPRGLHEKPCLTFPASSSNDLVRISFPKENHHV